MDKKEFRARIDGAATHLMLRFPFYHKLLASFEVQQDEAIPTACVNRYGLIRINPEFLAKLSIPQSAFLLCHEMLHPSRGHFERSKMHDPSLANEADDYVINGMLHEDDPSWFIPCGLLDDQYTGLDYETVYGLVADKQKKNAKSKNNDSTEAGDSWSGPGGIGSDVDRKSEEKPHNVTGMPDESSNQTLGEYWQAKTVEAAEYARAMGNLPASIQRMVNDILASRVPWQHVLRASICDALSTFRIDWSRPSRRSSSIGVYMPKEQETGRDCTVVVDTSGSISEENLQVAVSEITNIIRLCGGKVRYLAGDADVHKDVMLRHFNADSLEGGGGTDFRPFFSHLDRHPTKLVVFFTDTFGHFPDYVPRYPTIWAVYGNAAKDASVPFGVTVEIPEA